MEQSKKITEGAILAGIYLVLLVIALFIPTILMFGIVILPVPFIIYAAKHSIKSAMIMFLVTLFLSFLIQPVIALPVTVLAGIGGMLLGEAIYRKKTPYETLAQGTIGFIIGFVFMIVYSQFVFQINLLTELETMIRESTELSSDMMKQLGFTMNVEESKELFEQAINQMITLIPVGTVFTSLIIAFIAQWISYRVISRLENKKMRFIPFRYLQFPIAMIWIYFIAIIMSYFIQDVNSSFGIVMNNVLTLVGLLLCLQGLSFLFYYVYAKKQSNALPIIVIILTILFPFLLLYLVRILGIIDLGFGLRKRISKK